MSTENMSELIQMQLGDYFITVDAHTAEQLQSSAQMRQIYLNQIKDMVDPSQGPSSSGLTLQKNENSVSLVSNMTKELEKNTESTETKLLWSARHPNPEDIEATKILLEKRKELDPQFSDKKHAKTMLWSKISNEMKKLGYNVGDGERCRKKFANLQAGYMKFKDEKKQTGAGKIEKPVFFDEIDIILGDKHKTVPPLLIDSINIRKEGECDREDPKVENKPENKSTHSSKVVHGFQNIDEGKGAFKETENTPSCKNKFLNTKHSVKPNKNGVLEKMYELQKEDSENRRQEFGTLMSFLEKQSERRHEEVMLMLQNEAKKGKKRYLDDD